MKQIYIDGSTRQTATVIDGVARVLPIKIDEKVTTNQGEYYAVLAGLCRAKELGLREVEILSDSQLTVRQLNTLLNQPTDVKYKIKNEGLAILASDVAGMVYWLFDKVKFTWTPRNNPAGEVLG